MPSVSLIRQEGNNYNDAFWGRTLFDDRTFAYTLNDVDYLVTVADGGNDTYDISAFDIKDMCFYRASNVSSDTPLSNVLGNPVCKVLLGTQMPTNIGGLAEEYSPARYYAKDEVVLRDGVFYRCTDTTYGAWDDTKWTGLTFSYMLSMLQADDTLDANSQRPISNRAVTNALNGKADKSTEINGQSLRGNVYLDATDIGMTEITTEEIDGLFADNGETPQESVL